MNIRIINNMFAFFPFRMDVSSTVSSTFYTTRLFNIIPGTTAANLFENPCPIGSSTPNPDPPGLSTTNPDPPGSSTPNPDPPGSSTPNPYPTESSTSTPLTSGGRRSI